MKECKILKTEIRKDLKNIRYYYMYKKDIQEAVKYVGENYISKKLAMYNDAIQKTPIQLYNLYYNLYILGYTQEYYSDKVCYNVAHVSRLNSQLINFLYTYLNNN
ncbi:MAG: hypothetical protein PHR96_03600 [Clostridia bacterium]|nr:hypothetical protein [Clostridia bacterium]